MAFRAWRMALLLCCWIIVPTWKTFAQPVTPTLEWELDVGAGHRGAVTRVAFSADGVTVFTAGQDGALKRWDVSSGQLLASWDSNASSLSALDVSPDGRVLAMGGSDGVVQVRSAETGRILQQLRAHDSEVTTLAFSMDGKMLASAGKDARVRIWTPSTGREIKTLTGVTRNINAVLFSPDLKTVYAAGADAKIFRWNFTTGKPLRAFDCGENVLTTLAIANNGRYLAAGGWDQQVRLFDLKSEKIVRTLSYHKNWVTDMAFSPDSNFLLTASRDRELVLWPLKGTRPASVWRGHTGMISSVRFSPDGNRVVSGSWDGTARLWHSGLPDEADRGGLSYAVLKGQSTRVSALSWAPGGRKLAAGYPDGTLWIWDTASGSVLSTLKGSWSSATAMVWTSSNLLALGGEDGNIVLWTGDGNLRRRTISTGAGPVLGLASSPDGGILASVSSARQVQLWKVPSGEPVRTLALKSEPTAVRFIDEGKMLLIGQANGEVVLHNIETGTVDKPLISRGIPVRSLAYHRGTRKVAVGLFTGSILLYQLDERKQLSILSGHDYTVNNLVFSPDGSKLASVGEDLALRIWTMGKTESVVKRLSVPTAQLEWAPDNAAISLGGDGVRLFHPQTGEELSTLHRLAELSLRATSTGMFSGPEPTIKQVYYRRYERARSASEVPLCYLPEGFTPLVPPPRTEACNAQLQGKPLSRLDELTAPPPAPSRVHLVAAGIGQFQFDKPTAPLNLKYAAKDTQRVSDQLRRLYGKGDKLVSTVLLDKAATREAILSSLEISLKAAEGRNDELVLVYIVTRGGHDGAEFSLLPYDFDPESPLLTSISQTRLHELLLRYDARVLLVIDAGRWGETPPLREERESLLSRLVYSRQKTWLLVSSRGEETYEGRRFCRWGGGAFSCSWLEALRGKADQRSSSTAEGDGVVTLDELSRYLSVEVPDLVKRKGPPEAQQTPFMLRYGGRLTLINH